MWHCETQSFGESIGDLLQRWVHESRSNVQQRPRSFFFHVAMVKTATAPWCFLVCKKCKYRLWAIWEWNTTRKACFSTGSIHFGIWLVASMIQPPTCRCVNCVNCVNFHQLLCFYWKQPGEYGRNKSQNPCGSLSMAGPPSLFRGWTPHIKSCWTTSIPFQIISCKSN